MKNLVFAFFICAFASTGFSQSIQNELDEPEDSRLNSVHSIVFGLAKETLIKLQDNLRSAGREEDVKKINDFISKTDKYLDVSDDEKVDLNDHLDSVYQLIDQYKDFIPTENLQNPNPPITEELIQALIEQLTLLIEKFEAKKQYAKAKLLLFYKYLLTKLAAKKAKWKLKKEKFDAFILFIIDLIRRFAEEIGIIPTPPPVPGTFEDDDQFENLKISMYRSDVELVQNLLDVIAVDLEKIERGLMEDQRYIEATKIKLYEALIKAVRSNSNSSNADRRSVRYALDKGSQLVKQYEVYVKKRTNWLSNVSIKKDKIDKKV